MSASVDIESIDEAIVDPGIYARHDLYHPLFARLRREDPVRWTTPANYRPFWTVSKHADILEVQRKPDIFLNAPRTTLNTVEAEEKIKVATGGRTQVQRSVVSMDAEEHAAMRNVTREWFLPRSVNKLQADIDALAREFVDRLAARGGACDFVQDIAVWYPLRVILRIFGLPPEEEGRLLRLSKEFNGSQDPELQRSRSQGEHTLQIVREFFDYFAELAADRRVRPRDDLASIIANATAGGQPLRDLDVFSYYLTISVAGHDTTSASTAGGLLALIQNPNEWAKLKADPDLVRTAVDEMVRWTHPVKHFFRTAARDYELRGRKIRAGDHLLMCYPSACRDEEVFEDPFAFRVDRTPNPHLAFGAGPHLCLGQHLAKVEMASFYRELVQRVSHFELAGEPADSETLFMGGLKRLPVRYVMEA